MIISMQERDSKDDIEIKVCDVGIVGIALDDRGKAAIDYFRAKFKNILEMEYFPDDYEVKINGNKMHVDDVEIYFSRFMENSISLEATTLGFVEIFLCCRSIQQIGLNQINILYVEPQKYSKIKKTERLLHKRDFILSEEFPGYRAVPGATFMLSDRSRQRGVFFLGYEERRLDRALEDYQMIQPSNCCVVFGVPAFKPGWEMDAFANNIRVIRDKNIRGGIHYCGAENPAATIDLLAEIHSSLGKSERMFIAPIGTKPNGIGAAIFASYYSEVGILYDHPHRKIGRSKKVAKWHLYDIEFGDICG